MEQLILDFAKVQPEIVAERPDEAIKLRLGEFAGPLDLLLHLIKREQVNIYDIPIGRITDEYLRYLLLMKTLDISVAGDFLVMAATLIEIKSKMLLPPDPELDLGSDDHDPRRELVYRLLEHQKFRSAAQMLWEKNTVENSVFPRGKIEIDNANSEINVGVFDLHVVFQRILARRKETVMLEIEREEISLTEMLEKIKTAIYQQKTLNLTRFFLQTRRKSELVLAFLAVLELVKSAQIQLVQTEIFGQILAKAK